VSTKQTFALCLDCWELHYGVPDSNGVYSRDSGSSNHFDHAVHVFGSPDDYPSSFEQPIRQVLIDLQMGMPISDARIEMFSLCCALTAIQPNNGVAVHEPPLGVIEHEEARRKNMSHRDAEEMVPGQMEFAL
jgi:hypothetical protein